MIYEINPFWLFAAFVLAVIAALCYAARVRQLKKELKDMIEDRDVWKRECSSDHSKRLKAEQQAARWKSRVKELQEDVDRLETRIHC